MVNILVLCIACEEETEKCTEQYISFKSNLQSMVANNSSITVHDLKSINRLQERRNNKAKLADKLEKKINECHVICVVLSPSLKAYVDDGRPIGLMKQDEREVLLKGLENYKEKKVVCISLDDSHVEMVPQMFQDVRNVHGSKDLSKIVEIILPAKFFQNQV